MKTSLIYVFFLVNAQVLMATGSGVAVFKDQNYHADSSANPIPYTEFVDVQGPFVKLIFGLKEQTIDRAKFVARIDVLSAIPAEITNETEIQILRKSLAETKAFAAKYAKSAPILQKQIESMTAHIAQFEAGKVRYSGRWIPRAEYDAIAVKKQQELEEIKIRELVRAEELRIRREKEEQFAIAQRGKGLEKYGVGWFPSEEVKRLRKRDSEIEESWKVVQQKMVSAAVYSIFQVANDGMLVKFHKGKVKQGGLNTDIAYLFGAARGMAAEGDYYKGDIYWCGTYTYQNLAGIAKTVNAYSLDKGEAIKRVRVSLYGDENAEVAAGADPNDRKIPEVLEGATGSGSGFFVGEEGYFVTNAHVVDDAKTVSILHMQKRMAAKIVKVSKVADLALLKVETPISGIEIYPDEAQTGQDVFAIGFPQPGIQGLEVKVTKGIISSSKGLNDDDTRFQIDAAVQPGNSGGPLCDTSGRLVGVVVATLTGTQNVNYAIKASEVRALLRSKSIRVDGPRAKSDLSGVKLATSATGLVVVR